MANVAVLLAKKGYNIACIDLDINAPGLDIAFGIDNRLPNRFITDYLLGDTLPLSEMYVLYERDIYEKLNPDEELDGKLYIFPTRRVPEPPKRDKFSRIAEGMEKHFKPLCNKISSDLSVDYILTDLRSGFTDEFATLFTKSDKLFVNTRYSYQHMRGTGKIIKFLDEFRDILGKFPYFVVINDVPRDLPEHKVQELEDYKKEYAAAVIKENRELRWRDRIVVLDQSFKDEEHQRQHEELIKGYEEIIGLLES
jgi:MinD-like ATPase involved in chromosome partitioning or flagellar assembly